MDPAPTHSEARLATALADRYRLDREVGAGGMATVYLAHDLRHERKVAIKVLRLELAAVIGAERFLREIRTIANLQHPHILGLIDSGEVDGTAYYVMPFVEGESLRDRLNRETQLPVGDAVRLATQVAGALDYAHRHGVIHRDIKPENILLHDGAAVVADFGIALAISSVGSTRMTETGMSIGTPHYMSPEQAMGERDITARSDVYALGCVTYEMLVGEPPFTGPTAQAIVAKVMTEKPAPIRLVRDTVPPHVEAAVLTALAKLPADRWPTAARFAEALAREDGNAANRATRPMRVGRSPRRPALATLAVAALGAAAALGWWFGQRARVVAAPWSAFTQLTDASGIETSPALSPDGESFAFVRMDHGTSHIYVQRVGGRNPILVGDSGSGAEWPAYSPDGKQIAYNAVGGGVFVMGATGESPRRLTSTGGAPAWAPDGQRIVYGSQVAASPYGVTSGALWTVPVSGGEPSALDVSVAFQPSWSPSGARIAFWSVTNGQRDIETVRSNGRGRVKLTEDVAVDWAPVWAPDGRALYFASDRGGSMAIWRIGLDEQSGRPAGLPEPVAGGADVALDLPRISRDGQTLIFRSKTESVNPAAVAFDPRTARIGDVRLLQHRTGILVPTDMSRDGAWLALMNAPDQHQDVFIMRPDGSGLTRLTDDDARDWFPRFSPDGQALLFYSNLKGRYDGWSVHLDGGGRTLLTALAGETYTMFSPDGKQLLVGKDATSTSGIAPAAPLPVSDASVAALANIPPGESFLASRWSPGGRWLAGGMHGASGSSTGKAVYDLAEHRLYRLSTGNFGDSDEIAWLPGERQVVYFAADGALVVQDVASLERRLVLPALPYPPSSLGDIVISPDGRTLYYGAWQLEANIWMVRRSPKGGAAGR